MSGSCKGIHCPGCGDGGGGIIMAIGALIVVALAYHARYAIMSAVSTLVQIVLIIAIAIGGVAVGAIVGYISFRIYRWKHPRMLPQTSQSTLTLDAEQLDALIRSGLLDAIQNPQRPATIKLPPSQIKVLRDERK